MKDEMHDNQTEAEVEELLKPELQEPRFIDAKKLNLREETLSLNRVAKVVKGGRRFSFAALVAVGDGNGHLGLGFGKANEVPDAISKAGDRARKNIVRVPLMGRTIPHEIIGRHDSARVLLKPASEGTGLIAGSSIRLCLSLAGIHDILAKSMGSDNVLNVIKATINGLTSLKRADEIARLRGKKIESLVGAKRAKIYETSRSSSVAAADPEAARRAIDAAVRAQELQEARALRAAATAAATAVTELSEVAPEEPQA